MCNELDKKQCRGESNSTALLCLEFDDDGYPTDESLEQIKNYRGSHATLMAEVAFLFEGYGRCEYRDIDNTWEVVTGGWSGCESVIQALTGNNIFWLMSWYMSKRGGYYEFKTKT